jgi:hypothetical protein
MVHEDAVDESKLTLCCALCCANCSTMATCGCSGRVGLCCTNIEFCCKPGAPKLPCCCIGPTCDGEGCINAQVQLCCLVVSAAIPCTDEVPAAVTIAGLTIYPKVGCCMPMKEIMDRD